MTMDTPPLERRRLSRPTAAPGVRMMSRRRIPRPAEFTLGTGFRPSRRSHSEGELVLRGLSGGGSS